MGFYKSFTFMIAFMILLVFMNMALGSKFTEKFLILVLASMIVFNVDKFEKIAQGLSNKPATGGGGSSGGAGASRSF